MRWASLVICLVLLSGSTLAADPSRLAGIDDRAGAQLPLDVSLQDGAGRPTTIGEAMEGKPALLVPVLYHCPNICPITLADLFLAIQRQTYRAGKDFNVIPISIDPREGPADARYALRQLRQVLPQAGLADVQALSGSADAIAAVMSGLGYRYGWDDASRQYAHIAAVAVVTADGKLSRWLYGVAPRPADISLALTQAGQGKLGRWDDQLLLLCFHYDPATGRYTPRILTWLKIAGALTIAGLGLFLAAMILRRPPPGRAGG